METNQLIYTIETKNPGFENFYFANSYLPQVQPPKIKLSLEEPPSDLLSAFKETQFLPYASSDFDQPRPVLQGYYFDEYNLKKVKERCGCSKGKKGTGFPDTNEEEDLSNEKCNLH